MTGARAFAAAGQAAHMLSRGRAMSRSTRIGRMTGLDAGLGERTGEGEGWRSLRGPAEGDINQGPPRLS